MNNKIFEFSLYGWQCVPVAAALVAELMPLVFWRGHRFAYACCVSMILLLGIIALAVIDWNACTAAGFRVFNEDQGVCTNKSLGVMSQHGGIEISFEHLVVSAPSTVALIAQSNRSEGRRSPEIVIGRAGPKPRYDRPTEYPRESINTSQQYTSRFIAERWGFEFLQTRQPPQPRGLAYVLRSLLILPDWFAALMFSILPLLWCVRRPARKRNDRQRRGQCLRCAYDLTGTPPAADGTRRCSECGTLS